MRTGRNTDAAPEIEDGVNPEDGRSGSDGLSSGAKPPVAFVPATALWVSALKPRHPRGRSGRESYLQPRPRRLDVDRLRLARALAAQGRTLREIAAAVGASHETVRKALRAPHSALAAD
jgi:hypothetical protein